MSVFLSLAIISFFIILILTAVDVSKKRKNDGDSSDGTSSFLNTDSSNSSSDHNSDCSSDFGTDCGVDGGGH